MALLQRPKPDENEDDLIKQNESFNKNLDGNIYPAAKVVQIGKRKTENETVAVDPASHSDNIVSGNNDGRRSKFSESRAKKKKESFVDNTILFEADKQKVSVLNPIVERDVPSLSPLMAHWEPVPSPHGFPQAPNLNIKRSETTPTVSDSKFSQKKKKKSLYMQHIEKEELSREESGKNVSMTENVVDKNLMLLGNKSFIVDGRSGLGKADDSSVIHSENMMRLSTMTHEQRLEERDDLLSKLSEEQVKFIISLRQRKEKVRETEKSESRKMELEEVVKYVEEESNIQMDSLNSDSSTINLDPVEQNADIKENKVEEISLSELPIPLEEAKKWSHMDKVELNKLKWMTNVPQPKPLKGKEGYVARFNLQGDLLPYDKDISWREGLHHHGDEPGRAGYSLDELFLFVRSQVIQQRHLGLKTLGNILRNAAEGLYDSCFDVSLLQLMIDAGLVILLRFALDETSALVYAEALRALYYLIGNEPDEVCLSIAEPWTPLGVQPGFASLIHSRERDREELNVEEKELKDVEVIKLDVIRALVRMDVHVRLRYLFESVPLSPPDVLHALGILRRIARHSLTAAWTLMRTPRLIETIVRHFLPHNTTPLLTGKAVNQLTSVYGVPLSQALSLLKVLASRGRQIAATLLEDHSLINQLMAYASMEPSEVQMPLPEVLTLSQETFYLWSIFLSYGLLKSQQGFTTFYPLFVKQLLFYRDKLDINRNVDGNQYNYEIGAHLANVLTKGLCVASTESLLSSRMRNNEPSFRSNDGKNLVLQPPVLEWKDFEEIFRQVETCLTKWLHQLSDFSEITFSGFKLLGSFCSFYSVYLENWRDQRDFDGIAFIKKMDNILPQLVSPFQDEIVLSRLLKNLRNSSALCSLLALGTCRDVPNLGSLGSVCQEGKVTPVLQKESPFPFILPYTKLLKTICLFYPSVSNSYFSPFLNNPLLKTYFNDVCNSSHSLSSQWFTRAEIYTVTYILQLANLQHCNDVNLFHRTALTLISLVHKGDEHIIKSLLTDVICEPKFLEDISTIETSIDALTLKEYKPLRSPSVQQPVLSSLELTKSVLIDIPFIGKNFIKNILHSKILEKSSITEKCIPFLINDLTSDREEIVSVVDPYWTLVPLKMLLLLRDVKSEDKNNQSQPETILSATNWLQMTFFVLKYRKEVMAKYTDAMGWIRHLSLVFLALNDLFLDANISSYVQASVIAIMESGGFEKLDPTWTFPDLQPCEHWYIRMVEQFASLSYGDSTFAFFIILPLLRKWPSSYKLALFGDSSDALPFIKLSSEEVSQFIPIEKFLDPPEDDQNVIIKYRSAVGQMLVSKQRTPFLFEFVNYHILKFCKKL